MRRGFFDTIRDEDKARIERDRDKRIYSHDAARARRKAQEERRKAPILKFTRERCRTGDFEDWCPLGKLYTAFKAMTPPPHMSKVLFSKYLQDLSFEKLEGRCGGFRGVYFAGIDLE